MDFVQDRLLNDGRYSAATSVDTIARHCPVIGVDTSLSGKTVAAALDEFAATRWQPKTITVDSGSDSSGRTGRWKMASPRSSAEGCETTC